MLWFRHASLPVPIQELTPSLASSTLAIMCLASLPLLGCSNSNSQPAGDKTACNYYQQWLNIGGATTNFGQYTDLLDAAWNAATDVPNSDAKAISNGLSQPPANDPAGQLLWDLDNTRADAEGRFSPPTGWSDEVGAVTIDCDKKL